MNNLDLSCADFGRKLSVINNLEEKLLQDSLSVLEEQGLYAFFLYLKAHGKEPGNALSKQCFQFMHDNPVISQKISGSNKDVFDAIINLSDSIDDLIFARELLLKALVYARYHLKATKSSEKRT